MTNLKISNNLDGSNAQNFLYRGPGVQLPGIPIPPGNTHDIVTYIDDVNYSFNIEGARIHNSSIAVSLKDFSHSVELVDKCLAPDNFVLLRFVPIDNTALDPTDIKVEYRRDPMTFVGNSSATFQDTKITFNALRYPRNANLKKIYHKLNQIVFNAQHPITNSNINVGLLTPTEILEIYLQGVRLDKWTKFGITIEGIPLKIILSDYDINYGGGITPHIEASIEHNQDWPGNINITIQGDET